MRVSKSERTSWVGAKSEERYKSTDMSLCKESGAREESTDGHVRARASWGGEESGARDESKDMVTCAHGCCIERVYWSCNTTVHIYIYISRHST